MAMELRPHGIVYRAGAINAQPGNVQPWWIRYSLVLFQQERDFDSLAFLRRLQSKFEGVGEVGADPPPLCVPPEGFNGDSFVANGNKITQEKIASTFPFTIWITCTMTYRSMKILLNRSYYAVVSV